LDLRGNLPTAVQQHGFCFAATARGEKAAREHFVEMIRTVRSISMLYSRNVPIDDQEEEPKLVGEDGEPVDINSEAFVDDYKLYSKALFIHFTSTLDEEGRRANNLASIKWFDQHLFHEIRFFYLEGIK